MSLTIDPRDLPDAGLYLEGHLPATLFDLHQEDHAAAKSPLDYNLHVLRDGNDIFLTGTVGATFQLECGRCAENYDTRIEISPYGQHIELENEALIDLTTILREDILLALPTYPRCEQGNLSPRKCPAEGRFESPQETLRAETAEAEQKVWGPLDQLNNLERN